MGIRIQKKVSEILQGLRLRANTGNSKELLVRGQRVDRGDGRTDSRLVRGTSRVDNETFAGDAVSGFKNKIESQKSDKKNGKQKTTNRNDSTGGRGTQESSTVRPKHNQKTNKGQRNFVPSSESRTVEVGGVHVTYDFTAPAHVLE